MAVLDEDYGTDLTLAEGGSGTWTVPTAPPPRQPREWRSRYEQEPARAERERARADAAEARCEDLRWAEVASRTDAGSWKSRFKACRRKLSEAVDETKETRRAARDVPSLQAEVARRGTLLCEAGIESSESSRVETLRKALATPETREGGIGPRPAQTRRRRTTTVERSPSQKDTIRSLRTELGELRKEVVRRGKQIVQLNKRLDQEKERSESIRETAKKLSSESLRHHREVRILRDCEARARSLSDEVYRLRFTLEVKETEKDKLKARVV